MEGEVVLLEGVPEEELPEPDLVRDDDSKYRWASAEILQSQSEGLISATGRTTDPEAIEEGIKTCQMLRHDFYVSAVRNDLIAQGYTPVSRTESGNNRWMKRVVKEDDWPTSGTNATPDIIATMTSSGSTMVKIIEIYGGLRADNEKLEIKKKKYSGWADALVMSGYIVTLSVATLDSSDRSMWVRFTESEQDALLSSRVAINKSLRKLKSIGYRMGRNIITTRGLNLAEPRWDEPRITAMTRGGSVVDKVQMKVEEGDHFLHEVSSEMVSEAFDDAKYSYSDLFNCSNPKRNIINFNYSFMKGKEFKGMKENKQLEFWSRIRGSDDISKGFIQMLESVTNGIALEGRIKPPSEGFKTQISRMGKEGKMFCRNVFKIAKVNYKKRKLTDEEAEDINGERPKITSWDPANDEHLEEAKAAVRMMSKLDEEDELDEWTGLEMPGGSESIGAEQKRISDVMLRQWQSSKAGHLTRWVGLAAQSVRARRNVMGKGDAKRKDRMMKTFNIDARTHGRPGNVMVVLPHKAATNMDVGIPYLIGNLTREKSELLVGCGIYHQTEVETDIGKMTLTISMPQRLSLQQFNFAMNAELNALLSWVCQRIEGKSAYESSAGKWIWAWSALTPHLSLSYLAENIRYLVQLSIAKHSALDKFIEKIVTPLKSPLELAVWCKLKSWSITMIEKTRMETTGIRNIGRGITMINKLSDVTVPSLWTGHMIPLKSMLNSMYILIQSRSKNMHDPLQGMTAIMEDLSELDLQGEDEEIGRMSEAGGEEAEWAQRGDVPISSMTWGSKFTYDSSFLREAMKYTEKKYIKGREIELKKAVWQAGSYDDCSTLASARGSRYIDGNGKFIASTNIQEAIKSRPDGGVRVIDIARKCKKYRFSYAQKQQAGGDRGIGITTFDARCHLAVTENIARAYNKFLPNEAISISGESKVQRVEQKVKSCTVAAQVLEGVKKGSQSAEKMCILMASFDNTKHSEQDAPIKYANMWMQSETAEDEWKSVISSSIEMMGNREVFLPDRVRKQMAKRKMSKKTSLGKKFRGKDSTTFRHGWVQGMYNNLSTNCHAMAQIYAMDVVIPKITGHEMVWEGDVHSDDSWFICYFKVREDEDEKEMKGRILDAYYWCMQGAGFRLNPKKCSSSDYVVEFLSRFMMGGDMISTFVKSTLSVCSPLPYRGVGTDMPAAISKIQAALRDGCPHMIYPLLCWIAEKQVDDTYSLGVSQENDVEGLTGCARRNIPLGMGGRVRISSHSLEVWGTIGHWISLVKDYRKLKLREKNMVRFAIPNAGTLQDADNIYTFEGSMNVPRCTVPSKKAVEEVTRGLPRDWKEMKEELMARRPTSSFIRPTNDDDAYKWMISTISSPSFSLGIRGGGTMAGLSRAAGSVRGEVWWLGDSKVTLKEWLDKARSFTGNEETYRMMEDGVTAHPAYEYMSWDEALELEDIGDRENLILNTMSDVKLPESRYKLRVQAQDLVLYITDRASYLADDRRGHTQPSWKSDMEVAQTLWAKLKEENDMLIRAMILFEQLRMLGDTRVTMMIPAVGDLSLSAAMSQVIRYNMCPWEEWQIIDRYGSTSMNRIDIPVSTNMRMLQAAMSFCNALTWVKRTNKLDSEAVMTQMLESSRAEGGETMLECVDVAINSPIVDNRSKESLLMIKAMLHSILGEGLEEQIAASRAAELSLDKRLIVIRPQRMVRVGKRFIWTGRFEAWKKSGDNVVKIVVHSDKEGKMTAASIIMNATDMYEATKVLQLLCTYMKINQSTLFALKGSLSSEEGEPSMKITSYNGSVAWGDVDRPGVGLIRANPNVNAPRKANIAEVINGELIDRVVRNDGEHVLVKYNELHYTSVDSYRGVVNYGDTTMMNGTKMNTIDKYTPIGRLYTGEVPANSELAWKIVNGMWDEGIHPITGKPTNMTSDFERCRSMMAFITSEKGRRYESEQEPDAVIISDVDVVNFNLRGEIEKVAIPETQEMNRMEEAHDDNFIRVMMGESEENYRMGWAQVEDRIVGQAGSILMGFTGASQAELEKCINVLAYQMGHMEDLENELDNDRTGFARRFQLRVMGIRHGLRIDKEGVEKMISSVTSYFRKGEKDSNLGVAYQYKIRDERSDMVSKLIEDCMKEELDCRNSISDAEGEKFDMNDDIPRDGEWQ